MSASFISWDIDNASAFLKSIQSEKGALTSLGVSQKKGLRKIGSLTRFYQFVFCKPQQTKSDKVIPRIIDLFKFLDNNSELLVKNPHAVELLRDRIDKATNRTKNPYKKLSEEDRILMKEVLIKAGIEKPPEKNETPIVADTKSSPPKRPPRTDVPDTSTTTKVVAKPPPKPLRRNIVAAGKPPQPPPRKAAPGAKNPPKTIEAEAKPVAKPLSKETVVETIKKVVQDENLNILFIDVKELQNEKNKALPGTLLVWVDPKNPDFLKVFLVSENKKKTRDNDIFIGPATMKKLFALIPKKQKNTHLSIQQKIVYLALVTPKMDEIISKAMQITGATSKDAELKTIPQKLNSLRQYYHVDKIINNYDGLTTLSDLCKKIYDIKQRDMDRLIGHQIMLTVFKKLYSKNHDTHERNVLKAMIKRVEEQNNFAASDQKTLKYAEDMIVQVTKYSDSDEEIGVLIDAGWDKQQISVEVKQLTNGRIQFYVANAGEGANTYHHKDYNSPDLQRYQIVKIYEVKNPIDARDIIEQMGQLTSQSVQNGAQAFYSLFTPENSEIVEDHGIIPRPIRKNGISALRNEQESFFYICQRLGVPNLANKFQSVLHEMFKATKDVEIQPMALDGPQLHLVSPDLPNVRHIIRPIVKKDTISIGTKAEINGSKGWDFEKKLAQQGAKITFEEGNYKLSLEGKLKLKLNGKEVKPGDKLTLQAQDEMTLEEKGQIRTLIVSSVVGKKESSFLPIPTRFDKEISKLGKPAKIDKSSTLKAGEEAEKLIERIELAKKDNKDEAQIAQLNVHIAYLHRFIMLNRKRVTKFNEIEKEKSERELIVRELIKVELGGADLTPEAKKKLDDEISNLGKSPSMDPDFTILARATAIEIIERVTKVIEESNDVALKEKFSTYKQTLEKFEKSCQQRIRKFEEIRGLYETLKDLKEKQKSSNVVRQANREAILSGRSFNRGAISPTARSEEDLENAKKKDKYFRAQANVHKKIDALNKELFAM